MKVVVVKSPKVISGLMRLIFKAKRFKISTVAIPQLPFISV